MIELQCPCGMLIVADDSQAGRKAKCPQCRRVHQLPAAPPAPASGSHSSRASSARSLGPSAAAKARAMRPGGRHKRSSLGTLLGIGLIVIVGVLLMVIVGTVDPEDLVDDQPQSADRSKGGAPVAGGRETIDTTGMTPGTGGGGRTGMSSGPADSNAAGAGGPTFRPVDETGSRNGDTDAGMGGPGVGDQAGDVRVSGITAGRIGQSLADAAGVAARGAVGGEQASDYDATREVTVVGPGALDDLTGEWEVVGQGRLTMDDQAFERLSLAPIMAMRGRSASTARYGVRIAPGQITIDDLRGGGTTLVVEKVRGHAADLEGGGVVRTFVVDWTIGGVSHRLLCLRRPSFGQPIGSLNCFVLMPSGKSHPLLDGDWLSFPFN